MSRGYGHIPETFEPAQWATKERIDRLLDEHPFMSGGMTVVTGKKVWDQLELEREALFQIFREKGYDYPMDEALDEMARRLKLHPYRDGEE